MGGGKMPPRQPAGRQRSNGEAVAGPELLRVPVAFLFLMALEGELDKPIDQLGVADSGCAQIGRAHV